MFIASSRATEAGIRRRREESGGNAPNPAAGSRPSGASQGGGAQAGIKTLGDVVREWRERLGRPVKAFIIVEAEKRGLTYEAIVSQHRTAELVAIRYEIIALAYVAFPHMSLTRLGRAFRRDHTVIHKAAKKMGVLRKGTAK